MKSALVLIGILLLGTQQAPPLPASISGRVRGLGAPVPNSPSLRLAIGTLAYRDGRRVFLTTMAVQVDGLGNYQLQGVKPGEYYLRTDSPQMAGLATYYPGTTEVDKATMITVEQGQEIVGIDIDTLARPTFKISGTIRSIPAAAASNGIASSILGMTFASTDRRSSDPTAGPLVQTLRNGLNGEFEISLPAGEWDIFPVIPLRTASPQRGAAAPSPLPVTYATGRTRVLLTDRNVENVVINVGSADVVGRIVVPGSSTEEPARVAGMQLSLFPRDNYPSPLVAHLNQPKAAGASGEFTFASVPPGRFGFRIPSMPPDLYLAELRVGTKSVYDDGVITVGTEPLEPVEIVLSRGGGQVRVTISGQGAPTGGLFRQIVLVPSARRENALLYKVVPVGTSSSGSVANVAPGRYRVFAFQELPPGGAEQDADFMGKYENFGVTIDVTSGQTTDVQVPLIPSGK